MPRTCVGQFAWCKACGLRFRATQRVFGSGEFEGLSKIVDFDFWCRKCCARAAETATGDWRLWTVPQWNERLLNHFFGRKGDNDPPVVTLLVTPEELARSVGDLAADPTEVRNAFVAAVLATIVRSGRLLFDASNYSRWPRPPDNGRVPRFISHLLFTCIAASESSDDLASEGSFLERLRELTHDRLPDYASKLMH